MGILRVHCTPEDLLHVSIAERPAPLAELALALATLQRRDSHPAFSPWRRRTAQALPPQARPLLQLISPLGAGPTFLDPPTDATEEAIEHVLSTPRTRVRAELQRMCTIDRTATPWVRHLGDMDREAWQILKRAMYVAYRTVLGHAWTRIQAGFHADTTWRTSLLARRGLHAVLASLSATVRWQGTTMLETHFPRDLDIRLNGRGLILQPTLTWAGHLLVGPHPDGRVILTYPALTSLPHLEPAPRDDPIRALLGTTRAEALRLLTRDHTTTDLARELAITTAAASMQAKALREAGLIKSRRDGKAVIHRCTRLGVDLLTTHAHPPTTISEVSR
ncbi:MAG TPA: winged helix-turn-helix domain-containing protein [Mycobacteriales bacterium]